MGSLAGHMLMSSIVDRWHCDIIGGKLEILISLVGVAIVWTKCPTVGHKTLSIIGAGFYI